MTQHDERGTAAAADLPLPEHTPSKPKRARKAAKATNDGGTIGSAPNGLEARHGPGNGLAGPLPPGGDDHHVAIEGNGRCGEQSAVTESDPIDAGAAPQDVVPTGLEAQHRFLSMLLAGLDPTLHFLVAKRVQFIDKKTGVEREAFPAEEWREQLLVGPWYFSTGASDSKKLRQHFNMKALRAIVIDDVGTKVDPARILARPTWRLETSKGNFQYGFLLKGWTTDIHGGDELAAGLIAAGLQDPGVKAACRLFRIPGSLNDKPGRDNFKAVLHYLDENIVYTLDSLAKALKVEPVEVAQRRGRTGRADAPPAARADIKDEIFRWLDQKGMVRCEATGGWWLIACPFAHEHKEDPRKEAKYLPRDNAGTGLSDATCHHGHGQDEDAYKQRFFDWVVEQGGPAYDPEPAPSAGLAAFSEFLRKLTADNPGKDWGFQPVWQQVQQRQQARTDIAAATAGGRIPALDQQAILPEQWPVPRTIHNPDGTITRKIVSHPFNVEHLLKTYGFTVAYNVITKRLEWSHGGLDHTTDNADEALLSMVHGLCKLNGMPVDMLGTHLCAVAEANQRNPVVEYMQALKWDGKPHIAAAAARIECSHPDHAQVILRRWLIQACAAADAGEKGHAANPEALPVYESVMVLIGSQGINKTKGLLNLVPTALRRFVKTGLILDAKKKDSLLQACAYWIAELGEMDATFKRTEATTMKAWLSLHEDDIRKPFARTASRMKRRTTLCGSANEDNPLIDQTGNRRWWVLRVTSFALGLDAEALDQMWAEAWAAYVSGEQWWPLDTEKALLMAAAESARQSTGIEAKLTEDLNWESGMFRPERFTAAKIGSWALQRGFTREGRPGLHYEDLEDVAVAVLSPAHLREVGLAMRRLHLAHGAKIDKDGVIKQQRDGEWVKVNAADGKNRGWLVPATHGTTLAEALHVAKTAAKKAS